MTPLAATDLVYMTDEQPGISRRRRGRGFTYIAPDGTTIARGKERARLEALAVPATGDAAGGGGGVATATQEADVLRRLEEILPGSSAQMRRAAAVRAKWVLDHAAVILLEQQEANNNQAQ